jgi:hypothetical protein
MYRTRVGTFELDETRPDGKSPEGVLFECITSWRDNLIAGAGLTTTNLEREHPPQVFRHCQFRGTPGGKDDFYSPTYPALYIELRILPMVSFYKKRIPIYTRRIMILKTVVVLLGIAATVLAKYEQPLFITIVSGAAVSLVSWAEFSEAPSKVERYTKSITSLKNLLCWWDSLGDVQKATKDAIGKLVITSETIISEEQLAWTSSSSKQGGPDSSKDQAAAEDESEPSRGKRDSTKGA